MSFEVLTFQRVASTTAAVILYCDESSA
jgi:hypothetical protein